MAGTSSGALLGLAFWPFGPFPHWQWAVFFGFVPLWSFWLRAGSAREIFWSGWLCQFTFTLVAFPWIAYTVNEYGHFGPVVSALLLLMYCAVANWQVPLAGLAWFRFFPSRGLLALVILTAIGERLGTLIFHWNFGYAWYFMRWPGAQLADVTGFRWLCSVSICLNGLALAAWEARRTRAWRRPLLAGAAIFAAVNLAGWWRLRSLPAPDSVARVLLVQPNLENSEKEKMGTSDAAREAILEVSIATTDRALATLSAPPDFAVWPENAFPGFIADPGLSFGLSPRLAMYLRTRHLNLVTGGFGFSAKGKVTNGIFSLRENGTWLAPAYEKRVLLPFGETIPGAEIFPGLRGWLPMIPDYGRGDGPVNLRVGKLSLGGMICYEGLFDSLAREAANNGAQILVNVTNDSWYGPWLEPWQHFYNTAAKAVETRRPIIRSTNTGISAVVLANGKLMTMSPVGAEWFHLYEVPYRKNPTSPPFLRWGYWFDSVFLALGLALALILQFRRRGSIPGRAE